MNSGIVAVAGLVKEAELVAAEELGVAAGLIAEAFFKEEVWIAVSKKNIRKQSNPYRYSSCILPSFSHDWIN